MHPVQFLPDNTTASAQGLSVLETALRHGIPLTHACGGEAKCSTCRVMILEGGNHCHPPGPAEAALTQRLGFAGDVRLACQIRPTGPMTVRRLVLDETDIRLATSPLPSGWPEAVGEEKHLAVLFSDIRGFTRMSQRMLPYDIVHALNRHYEAMGAILGRHGGMINNIMGDGLMVLFEHMENTDHPALRATRAAVEMRQAVASSGKPYFAHAYGVELAIGVGIDYGRVIAGGIGQAESRRMTVIGETVNTASRIESANKETGTTVLVSDAVQAACGPAFLWRPHPDTRLPGINPAVTLYEPLSDNNPS
ncbi:MAG: adenylate/guanylate cyclase domain-containing protein [Candidatus Methylacidiphilales bacterium]|nr:adenylate/guanylate cyclase domain-containing protein [Candidatus Methylacidiphilales bacterium]